MVAGMELMAIVVRDWRARGYSVLVRVQRTESSVKPFYGSL